MKTCPVCQSINSKLLHEQDFVLMNNQDIRHDEIFLCKKCGIVFTDVNTNTNYFNQLYQDNSKYSNSSGSGGDKRYSIKRNRQLAIEISKYFPLLKNKPVIDIGCADGELLNELGKLGFNNITGVDPSEKSLQNVDSSSNFKLLKGFLGNIKTSQKYSLVILSHVLEHIYNISDAINNLKDLIANDGRLYIEVPDANRYCDYFVSPFHFFDMEHINHFTINSLKNLVKLNGFEVLDCGEKVIDISENRLYPACFVVCRLCESEGWYETDMIYHNCNNSVEKYIELSKSEFDSNYIDKLFSNDEPLIVYGCGASTTRLLGNSSLKNKNIQFFVDSNPVYWGQQISGKDIKPPEILRGYNIKVFIPSKLYGSEIKQMLLNELRYKEENILMLYDF